MLVAMPTTTIGEFLRSRREHLNPADVGLRDTGRRRTPGLRREEVATLAGISIDYLVRLEQGRDTNPSREVILALADALQLSTSERKHLSLLAAIGDKHELCPGAGEQAPPTLRPQVVELLERLQPTPAFVLGPYGDVLGWNDAWGDLVDALGFLDGDQPNLTWYLFEDERATAVYDDWEAAADHQVGVMHEAGMRWRDDQRLEALLEHLHQVPAFEERWARYAVHEKDASTKAFHHPVHGRLAVDYEVLGLGDESGQVLVTWLPADDATARVIDGARTSAPVSPARLRVVREGSVLSG